MQAALFTNLSSKLNPRKSTSMRTEHYKHGQNKVGVGSWP